jgi:hypothetical protein
MPPCSEPHSKTSRPSDFEIDLFSRLMTVWLSYVGWLAGLQTAFFASPTSALDLRAQLLCLGTCSATAVDRLVSAGSPPPRISTGVAFAFVSLALPGCCADLSDKPGAVFDASLCAVQLKRSTRCGRQVVFLPKKKREYNQTWYFVVEMSVAMRLGGNLSSLE